MPPGGTRDRAARHARHARRVAWSARSSAHFRRTRSTQTRHHGRTRAACQAHRAGIVTEVAAAGIEGSPRSAISGPRGAAQDCRSCPRLYPTHLRSRKGRQPTGPQHGKGPCSSRARHSAAAGAQPPSEQQSATQRAIERITAGSLSGTDATTKLRTCTSCDTWVGEPGVITGAREERAQGGRYAPVLHIRPLSHPAHQ